jgi:hypothetical protein
MENALGLLLSMANFANVRPAPYFLNSSTDIRLLRYSIPQATEVSIGTGHGIDEA